MKEIDYRLICARTEIAIYSYIEDVRQNYDNTIFNSEEFIQNCFNHFPFIKSIDFYFSVIPFIASVNVDFFNYKEYIKQK